MSSPVKAYTELIAWQKAVLLVTEIYKVSKTFPKDEVYGLTAQIRRAAVSVPSNIAEGQGRLTRGEFKQFLGNARGSLFEVQTQVHIAANLGYLEKEEASKFLESTNEVARIMNGLLKSLD
ncbi:MAG TPA: four helix bundle protein [Terriglobales bacterium]|nr:four helix bundle protein [Terriglobales bacterium]